MKFILLAPLSLFYSAIAHAESREGSFKCVSHDTFEFHDLLVQRENEGFLEFILDGEKLLNLETEADHDANNGMMVWPMDENDVETDELYCKLQ